MTSAPDSLNFYAVHLRAALEYERLASQETDPQRKSEYLVLAAARRSRAEDEKAKQDAYDRAVVG